MAQNLNSLSELTEFGPLDIDDNSSNVSGSLKKLLGFKTKDTKLEEESGENVSVESLPAISFEKESERQTKPDSPQSKNPSDRNLPNVVKRIGSLLSSKNDWNDLESKLKQYWMPDSVSKECYECCEKFNMFRRKHHCRVCGQIFCSICCNRHIPGKVFGCKGNIRVCSYCCKVIISYLQTLRVDENVTKDYKTLLDDLKNKLAAAFPDEAMSSTGGQCNVINTMDEEASASRKSSLSHQEHHFFSDGISNDISLSKEEKCTALRTSSSLKNLYCEISNPISGITLSTNVFRGITYINCFLGSGLVDWLILHRKAGTRTQGTTLGQALLDGDFIKSLIESNAYVDGYAFYSLEPNLLDNSSTSITSVDFESQNIPIWAQSAVEHSDTNSDDHSFITPCDSNLYCTENVQKGLDYSYKLQMNIEANAVYLSRPFENISHKRLKDVNNEQSEIFVTEAQETESGPESGWHKATSLKEEYGEKLAFDLLSKTYLQHEERILTKLLEDTNIPFMWKDIIIQLCHELINIVRPELDHDTDVMNINHFVKIKKLPFNNNSQSEVIKGVVFTKTTAHKHMNTKIVQPKILLLQCSIAYQRSEGKLITLEPMLMQEDQYLKHVTSRIVTLGPNIVLVQKNVSRLAQELFRMSGITLIQNVKYSILRRLSECTKADLVPSVDANLGRSKLGTCDQFYLKYYKVGNGQTKTLMFFEGLAVPNLGATVLLKGPTYCELTVIERIVEFMLYTSYNWKLEKSFLMDEFALPPKAVHTDEIEKNIILHKHETTDFIKELGSKDIGSEQNDLNDSSKGTRESNRSAGLKSLIINISPYIYFSEGNQKSNLYKSSIQSRNNYLENCIETDISQTKPAEVFTHPFISAKIVRIDDEDTLDLLASFRALGGRHIQKQSFFRNNCLYKNDNSQEQNHITETYISEIMKHQILSVLFYSFCADSYNFPGFCVNPWIAQKGFYNQTDISLGSYLRTYCFSYLQKCPSKHCDILINKHISRFVHSKGCISVTINNFDKDFGDDHIFMWSWCTKCHSVSPVIPMSRDTWSFSFAKYLEIRFYNNFHRRRDDASCDHSLHHDHCQYFGYKHLVATFKYVPIVIWNIFMPDLIIIDDFKDVTKYQFTLKENLNSLSPKLEDLYTLIIDSLNTVDNVAEDHLQFKHIFVKKHLELVETVKDLKEKLISSLENDTTKIPEHYNHLNGISNAIIAIKILMIDLVDWWNTNVLDTEKSKDSDGKKDKLNVDNEESNRTLIKASSQNLSHSPQTIPYDFSIASTSRDSKVSESSENDGSEGSTVGNRNEKENTASIKSETSCDYKKDVEKKTVKTLLSHLLPSSTSTVLIPHPFPTNEHYRFSGGTLYTIVVNENDPSSVIAYTLNSYDYRKQLEESYSKEQSSNEALGNLSASIDLDGNIQSLKQRSNSESPTDEKKSKLSYIEVQFQDNICNFMCRVYCAREFAALRKLILPNSEVSYIRSLLNSVAWNALGGKSGTHFAKTVDDRYVLKEVSKSELQLFLESAQNYFTYMTKCFTSKQPTLLGKIMGVYQIIFKNSTNVAFKRNLLIMENLFYNRIVSKKFDLKGSMRNRWVPDSQEEEIVLLDENLMRMACDSPLYISPKSKRILTTAIENDTQFLSDQSVMDYSLLVGLNSENKQLILGIIDYIRTFTWDKRLETLVKRSGILGGQGKLPTIMSPTDYQKRFIQAMHRYFLEVPNHWTGFDGNDFSDTLTADN